MLEARKADRPRRRNEASPLRAARRGRGFRRAALLAVALALGSPAAAEDAATGDANAPRRSAYSFVGAEVSRWGSDSVALAKAPASWDGTDWERFGLLSAGLGGLFLVDESVYRYVEEHRTEAGDRFARAVTPFGQEYAFGLSVGLLAGGLVFAAPGTRDTGRDALEASILSFVIANVVLKPVIGRQRPYVSNGETVFDPFSHDPSFPSGHATEAFAVASVIAMRSEGWVVPTLAYTTASLVAVSRVEQSYHFTSDVFAGAVLGVTVGRFVVSRHRPAPDGPAPAARVTLVAIPHGLAVHVSW
ncbi:MAG: phosphatase PAP2 family protein [Thermoanaerobaculia bacterium]